LALNQLAKAYTFLPSSLDELRDGVEHTELIESFVGGNGDIKRFVYENHRLQGCVILEINRRLPSKML
jgi:hypothetical protein